MMKQQKRKRSIKEIGDGCDKLSDDENEPREKAQKSILQEVKHSNIFAAYKQQRYYIK